MQEHTKRQLAWQGHTLSTKTQKIKQNTAVYTKLKLENIANLPLFQVL